MSPLLPSGHWVDRLGLQPHPEGGFYAETHRSQRLIRTEGAGASRAQSTSIHYLLGSTALGHFSAWHRLRGMEESWYFHYGSPLTLRTLDMENGLQSYTLGWGEDCRPDLHLPADLWFCAAVESDDPASYALVSCAVQPAFEFEDFEMAERTALQQAFPAHADMIARYCR